MRKIFYSFVSILFVVVCATIASSCSKDDEDRVSEESKGEESTVDKTLNFSSVEGIWKESRSSEENTSYTIVSIASDGYFTAVVPSEHTILSGILDLNSNKTATLTDDYSGKTVQLTILSNNSSTVKLEMEFSNIQGNKAKVNETLIKESNSGTKSSNTLIGRTIANARYYTETIYTKVETRYSGLQSRKSSFPISSDTRMIHYTYINGIAYFQVKQYENVATSKFAFTSNKIYYAMIENIDGEIQWNPKGSFSELYD